jgi:hypothetical protein
MNDIINDKCPRCGYDEHRPYVPYNIRINGGLPRCPRCGYCEDEDLIHKHMMIYGSAFVMYKSDGTTEVIHPEKVQIKDLNAK